MDLLGLTWEIGSMCTRRQETRARSRCAATRGAALVLCGAVCWMASAAAYAQQPGTRGAPLNYFLHAAGPAAAPTMRLGWMMTALSVAVSTLVALLLIVAIARKRPHTDPAALHC